MYCVYCGKILEGASCSHCGVVFVKKRVFTICSNKDVEYQNVYCFHCGKPVFIIFNNRPEEVAGICTCCHKPTRLNRKEKGDDILV